MLAYVCLVSYPFTYYITHQAIVYFLKSRNPNAKCVHEWKPTTT